MGREMKQAKVVQLSVNANKKTLITQKVVSGIKQRQKAYYIRDSKLIGFAIKVNPKGQAKYIVEAKLGSSDRAKRKEIGVVNVMLLAQAREIARDLLNDIHSGVEPKERQLKDGLSIQRLFEDYYRSNQRLKKERVESYINEMISVLKPFLNRHANDLSPQEYFDFFRKNVKSRPTVTDRVHRQLRAVYNYATRKQLVDRNPTDIVTTQDRPVIKPKDRSLSLDVELPKFLKALMNEEVSEIARDVVLVILATGMRRTEALCLRWDELDMYRYLITKSDTKNKHQHMIPMSNLVRTILLERLSKRVDGCEYVFPNASGSAAIGDVRKSLKRILSFAEIEDPLALHDLRRTFTAINQQLGLESYQIKALLNHVDNSVTHRHYEDKKHPKLIQTRRKLLNDVSDYLESLATGHTNGLRSILFVDSMFEEEKTDDGSLDYTYALEKAQRERKESRELTHQEMMELDPESYEYRNEELERAYDWER